MSPPPINTLIVDDEPAARAALRSLLAADPDIEVLGECADGASAVESIAADEPELLFLDIQMPEMDGFGVLQTIDRSRLPVVVFVTAYDRYALRAFDAHALDYLLKPFTDERFRDALAHAKEQVRRRRLGSVGTQLLALLHGVEGAGNARPATHLERLVIKATGRVAVVNVEDVDYFDAQGDYVRIHAGRSQHLLRETMKQLERKLDPARFVRIHRSTIVNVDRIRELEPYFRGEYVVSLRDGTRLKLSRGYKPKLEAMLGRSF